MSLRFNDVIIEDERYSAEELEAILRQRALQLNARFDNETMIKRAQSQTLKRLLCFRQANAHYGLEVNNLLAIEYIPKLDPMILLPDFVSGYLVSQGKLVGVVDLARWWKLKSDVKKNSPWVIVLEYETFVFGLQVDVVEGYCEFESTEIVDLSKESNQQALELTGWIPSKQIALLNVDRLTQNLAERLNW